ncbi:MAG: hypothetical protein NZ898_14020 [Myxococcota bacterium]|nr:hypothetical protein [Myxococcota bacterium]MDW8363892.1 hypothetical protein [Myxococcales bacterium]
MNPRILWSLAAGLALALPDAARAYFVESRFSEGGMPVPLRYDPPTGIEVRLATMGLPLDATAVGAALNAAAQTWTDVPCATFELRRGPDVTGMPDPYHWMTDPAGTPRYILVYFSADPALWDAPRVGYFLFAHDGLGKLIGATVVLNTKDHQWSTTGEATKMDVQGVLTALLGRSLGISSAMEGNATYPVYRAGDTSKRTLGADDTAALQFLYRDMSGGCAEPTPPERICTGMEPDCPPRPMTMPMPDGGMPGGRDGGGSTPDGGVGPGPGGDSGAPDGGVGTGDAAPDGGAMRAEEGGCSCRAPGRLSGVGIGSAMLVVVALVVLGVRRVRPRRL